MLAALLLQVAEPATALEAERAFARDAAKLGQWTAFGKWAHEDGVLVGRSIVRARDLAASILADRGEPDLAVAWWPAFSMASCDGDHVFNSGPYYSPADGQFGRFQTVWTRGAEGWRYLVDIGVRLDEPEAVERVEQHRASCENLPEFVPARTFDSKGAEGMEAMSADASLKWRTALETDEAGTQRVRTFRLWAWDGQDYALVGRSSEGVE